MASICDPGAPLPIMLFAKSLAPEALALCRRGDNASPATAPRATTPTAAYITVRRRPARRAHTRHSTRDRSSTRHSGQIALRQAWHEAVAGTLGWFAHAGAA